jgi:hypothetical protein
LRSYLHDARLLYTVLLRILFVSDLRRTDYHYFLFITGIF